MMAINTTLSRNAKGLSINCRTLPVVEEFFRNCAAGEVSPVGLFGRKWESPIPLAVYDLPETMRGQTTISSRVCYRLDRPGSDLTWVDSNSGYRIINIGFLRLVGTSLPDGVTFHIAGVWDKEDVINMAGAINEASQVIYGQYIRPMTIHIQHVLREDLNEQPPV